MTKLRVHAFSIALDGYGAGSGQDLGNPLGRGSLGYKGTEHVTTAKATHFVLTKG